MSDTATNCAALAAGVELDHLVAEHILGWRWWAERRAGESSLYWRYLAPPDWEPQQRFSARAIAEGFVRRADGTEEIPSDTGGRWCPHGDTGTLPCFSADVGAAWPVVDVLRRRYTNVVFAAANGWTVLCWNVGRDGDEGAVVRGYADTAPLAICRAALVAKGLTLQVEATQ